MYFKRSMYYIHEKAFHYSLDLAIRSFYSASSQSELYSNRRKKTNDKTLDKIFLTLSTDKKIIIVAKDHTKKF